MSCVKMDCQILDRSRAAERLDAVVLVVVDLDVGQRRAGAYALERETVELGEDDLEVAESAARLQLPVRHRHHYRRPAARPPGGLPRTCPTMSRHRF